MNRYLNTYNTYESRLQFLLNDGYDWSEATEIAGDEDLFNEEIFGEKKQITNFIDSAVMLNNLKNNKVGTLKNESKQNHKPKYINENGENMLVLQLLFWIPMLTWIIVLFMFD